MLMSFDSQRAISVLELRTSRRAVSPPIRRHVEPEDARAILPKLRDMGRFVAAVTVPCSEFALESEDKDSLNGVQSLEAFYETLRSRLYRSHRW